MLAALSPPWHETHGCESYGLDVDLQMTELLGVKIDYSTQCVAYNWTGGDLG
ncbi:MAG: hypothetical protein ABGX16_17015 [Pirellulales bacterium]